MSSGTWHDENETLDTSKLFVAYECCMIDSGASAGTHSSWPWHVAANTNNKKIIVVIIKMMILKNWHSRKHSVLSQICFNANNKTKPISTELKLAITWLVYNQPLELSSSYIWTSTKPNRFEWACTRVWKMFNVHKPYPERRLIFGLFPFSNSKL